MINASVLRDFGPGVRQGERSTHQAAGLSSGVIGTAFIERKLARILGVQRSAVTDWYAKRKTPTAEQVLALLEFLSQKRKTD